MEGAGGGEFTKFTMDNMVLYSRKGNCLMGMSASLKSRAFKLIGLLGGLSWKPLLLLLCDWELAWILFFDFLIFQSSRCLRIVFAFFCHRSRQKISIDGPMTPNGCLCDLYKNKIPFFFCWTSGGLSNDFWFCWLVE